MNAGLIRLCGEFVEGLPLLLPPEHRVEAIKAVDDFWWSHEAIVVGPLMPEWPDQKTPPATVKLLLTMHRGQPVFVDRDYRLTGRFEYWNDPREPSAEWEIAKVTMEALDALGCGPKAFVFEPGYTIFDLLRSIRERGL